MACIETHFPMSPLGRVGLRSRSMITDIHTHRPGSGAIVNLDATYPVITDKDLLYSVGIHPWNSGNITPGSLERLTALAAMPQVVAIGECGLDALRGADMESQQALFDRHIELSEQHRKPLIIHAVKTFPLIIEAAKRHRHEMPWIIHGFRGKPQLAEELLRHGFYLSTGARFNKDTIAMIPKSRLLLETDDSSLTIDEIARLTGTDLATAASTAADIFKTI